MNGKQRKEFIITSGEEHKGQRVRFIRGQQNHDEQEISSAIAGMKNVELWARHEGFDNLADDLKFIRERDCKL